jgi:hypothetical protein
MPKLHIPVVVPPSSKWCPSCKAVHFLEAFNHDRYRKDGLRTYCRPCDVAKWAASAAKRKDLNAAGKRLTNPTRVTPAERDRVNLAFLDAMTETPAARTARIAATVAARAALIASR